MTGPDDPRAALDEALAGLSDDQLRTVLGWVEALRRTRPSAPRPGSAGALADLLGITVEAQDPGRCRMRLTADPAWYNPNGVLHGGVVYTLVDYSMGGAVQPHLPPGEFCATIEVKISYLAPVRDATLTVETQVVKQGRTIAFTESKVTDDQGRLVATASGSMFIIRPNSNAT